MVFVCTIEDRLRARDVLELDVSKSDSIDYMTHPSIQNQDPLRMSKGKRQRTFISLIVLCLVFFPAYASANATYYTTDDNESNAFDNTADNDLDTLISSVSSEHPIEFDIDLTGALPTLSTVLAIRADDIDPGEVNQVLINGNSVGTLYGIDGLPSTSLFTVPNGFVSLGDNLVQIQVDNTPGLNLQVDWGQLLIDGENASNAQILESHITNYTTSPGNVSIETTVDLNILASGSYTVEVSLIDQNTEIEYLDSQTFAATSGVGESRVFDLPYSLFEVDGTFDIEVILYYNNGTFDVLEQVDELSFDHVQSTGPRLPAEPTTSTVSSSSSSIVANGSSTATITFQGIDVAGNNIAAGGQTVVFSSTSGVLTGTTDNGDGTYTTTLTSPTTTGTSIISVSVDGETVTDTATVTFVPGPADAANTTITLADTTLVADGMSSSAITIQAIDAFGNNLITGGDTISLFVSSGNIGVISDQGDGTYTAVLTSSTDIVTATVTGSINSFFITDSASVNYIVGPPSIITSTLTESVNNIYADGLTQSTITLQAFDIGNNAISVGGDAFVINTSLGTISATTDNGNGSYTAVLTSTTSEGSALVTATLASSQLNDTATIAFTRIPTTDALTINTQTPTITGTVTVIPGANFSVNLNGQTYIPGDGNLNLSGNDWRLTVPAGNALTDGTYPVTASVTDSIAQVTNDATNNELIIDITPPTLSFGALADLDSSNTITYPVFGTCTVTGDTITITGIDSTLRTVISSPFSCVAPGTFSEIIDFRALLDGTLTIQALIEDVAGNQTQVQTTVEKSACTPNNSTLACDSDGDTIPDGIEEIEGLNPNRTDSDLDGISDEIEYGSDLDQPLDTDGDGISDALDPDADNDGVLDIEESGGSSPPRDTDNDGIPDFQDRDSDDDHVPDALENAFGLTDADNDTILNILDLDSDGDGIPDSVENNVVTRLDSDNDGIDNAFDVDITLGDDNNQDGIDDDIFPQDTDHDGFFDMLDIDSDNDGLLDTLEANLNTANDSDADGIIDSFDADFTGRADADADGDNVDDTITLLDTDGDSFPNYIDLDSDNDSIPDVVETDGADSNPANAIIDNPETNQGTTPSTPDSDSDSIANYLDIESLNAFNNGRGPFDIEVRTNLIFLDANSDGLVDDPDENGPSDVDADGIADLADQTRFFFGSYEDHDNDGIANLNDLDDDNDGILDSIEGNGLVDSDNDGWADNADLDSDNDGVTDLLESQSGLTDTTNNGLIDSFTDVNNDGVDDSVDLVQLLVPADTDNDGTADFLDIDSDNDSVFDLIEANLPNASMLFLDSNNDGRIDSIVNQGSAAIFYVPVDTDGDTTPDYLDQDSDNDGLPDRLENTDANGDGLTDRAQVLGNELETSSGSGGTITWELLALLLTSVYLMRRRAFMRT